MLKPLERKVLPHPSAVIETEALLENIPGGRLYDTAEAIDR